MAIFLANTISLNERIIHLSMFCSLMKSRIVSNIHNLLVIAKHHRRSGCVVQETPISCRRDQTHTILNWTTIDSFFLQATKIPPAKTFVMWITCPINITVTHNIKMNKVINFLISRWWCPRSARAYDQTKSMIHQSINMLIS